MDIVERLRQRIGLVKFDSDAIALRDAADIIEQLRGQVEFESECRNGAYADVEIQNAKIERLRGKLREIYEVYAGSEGIPQPMTAAEGYLLSLLMEVVRIAQKALEKE